VAKEAKAGMSTNILIINHLNIYKKLLSDLVGGNATIVTLQRTFVELLDQKDQKQFDVF